MLFGNAYDLDQRKHDGGFAGLPPTLLAADLLGLVPQQLLPIEKVDPAEWYVNTFFPDCAATDRWIRIWHRVGIDRRGRLGSIWRLAA